MLRYLLVAAAVLGMGGTAMAEGGGGEIGSGTAVLETAGGKGLGTVCCVDKAGLFVATTQALAGMEVGSRVLLSMRAGGKEVKMVRGRVARMDDDAGVGLVMAEEAGDYSAMDLGGMNGLAEDTLVKVYAYPLSGSDHSEIVGTTNHVTWVKSSGGVARKFGLKWGLTDLEGCGPVVDGDGKVVGIADSGSGGVISSGMVAATLKEPVIVVGGDERVGREASTRPYLMRIRVIAPRATTEAGASTEEGTSGVGVSVLVDPDGKGIVIPATFKSEGVFEAQLPALATVIRSRELNASITFKSGSVTGMVRDEDLKVGGVSYRLTDVASMTRKADSTFDVELADGRRVTGALEMEDFDCRVGEMTCRLEMGQVTAITFAREGGEANGLTGIFLGGRLLGENLSFDETGKRVEIADSEDLSPAGDFTIAIDMVFNHFPQTTSIMDKGAVRDRLGGQWQLTADQNGTLTFNFRSGMNNAMTLRSISSVNAGERVTVILTHDAKMRRWMLHVTKQPPTFGMYSAYHWDVENGPISIGDSVWDGHDVSTPMNGTVNWVWVAQRAISLEDGNAMIAGASPVGGVKMGSDRVDYVVKADGGSEKGSIEVDGVGAANPVGGGAGATSRP